MTRSDVLTRLAQELRLAWSWWRSLPHGAHRARAWAYRGRSWSASCPRCRTAVTGLTAAAAAAWVAGHDVAVQSALRTAARDA